MEEGKIQTLTAKEFKKEVISFLSTLNLKVLSGCDICEGALFDYVKSYYDLESYFKCDENYMFATDFHGDSQEFIKTIPQELLLRVTQEVEEDDFESEKDRVEVIASLAFSELASEDWDLAYDSVMKHFDGCDIYPRYMSEILDSGRKGFQCHIDEEERELYVNIINYGRIIKDLHKQEHLIKRFLTLAEILQIYTNNYYIHLVKNF